eukprot:1393350-Rhodomonas_salina.2
MGCTALSLGSASRTWRGASEEHSAKRLKVGGGKVEGADGAESERGACSRKSTRATREGGKGALWRLALGGAVAHVGAHVGAH